MNKITLIEPPNGLAPTHFILNNKSEESKNNAYNDLDEYEEAKMLDSIYYGKENIVYGEIEDLGDYTLVNEMDLELGAECKANNEDKIMRRWKQ